MRVTNERQAVPRRARILHIPVLLLGALLALAPVAAPARAQETPGPGALEVDPEAAERALDRTLVVRGQLLLPPGQFEIEPAIGYEHTDRSRGINITDFDPDGDPTTAPVRVAETLRARRDRLTASVEAKVGLPFDSQFELRVPFVFLDEQVDLPISGISRDESTSGLGDIRVGFAKTLLRENGAIPDLVGRISWDTATGKDDEVLSITTGYDELIGQLSALKRIDPLVLTAGLSYQRSFEEDDVRPGDLFGFNVGTTLAASPSTALSLGFSAAFRQETEVNGAQVAASDQNEAYLTFGLGTVIRRNVLLSVSFGAGLTDDSSDYFVSASLPIRFSMR